MVGLSSGARKYRLEFITVSVPTVGGQGPEMPCRIICIEREKHTCLCLSADVGTNTVFDM